MGDNPPERDVKDVFKTHGKVRVNPTQDAFPTQRCSLLAVSNKYGLIFAGTPEGFKVLRQADLSKKVHEAPKKGTIIEDFLFWASAETGQTPTHLAVSADDLTLAVCLVKSGSPFALMYDIRSFATQGTNVLPFLEVRLSSVNNAELLDFAWNPGTEFATMFAACTSDGSLSLYEVADSLKLLAALPSATGAQALCWSPKGKQLVVGKKNGTLMQYDQQLKPKKEIPSPPSLAPGSMSVLDLYWQSTHVFVVAYVAANGDMTEPPTVFIITVPKGESPSYTDFGDVCFVSRDERKHKYYITQLAEWEILALTSSNALEAAVVGKHQEQKAIWERWNIDDSGRAELPLSEDYQETMPSGMAISLTCQESITLGENNVQPPSPLFLLLSTDGVLISFHMINPTPGMPTLAHPPEALSAAGARPSKEGLIPSKHATITSGTTLPLTKAENISTTIPTPAASTKPSIFGSLNLGQNTSTPAKGFSFGQAPAATSTAPATSTPQATTVSSLFSVKSTGATAFSFNKAADQSTTGQSSPAPGFSFPGSQATAPASSNQTQATSAAPSTFSFTGKLGSGLSLAGSPQTAQSSVGPKPPASVFGSLSATTSGANAGTAPSFSFKPAATPSVSAAPVSVVKPSPTASVVSTTTPPQPAAPAVAAPAQPQPASATVQAAAPASSTLQKSASAFSASQTTAGAKRPQVPSGAVAPQPSAIGAVQPQTSPQSRPTLRPQTAARRSLETPANTVDNPYVKSILDEMMHFNQELKDLSSRCKSINTFTIGSDEDKLRLRTGTEKMVGFCSDIKETMQSLNSDVTNLKTQELESFALLEECQIRQKRDKEPAYQELLRSRALDPASARLAKNIHSEYHYLESSIREIDMQLDGEWEEYQRSKNNARMIRTPATDALYQTLRNNMNTLNGQAQAIERLVGDLKEMRIYNTTSSWQASPTLHHINDRGDGSFSDGVVTPPTFSSNDANITSVKFSPEKQARLREVLSKRRMTPVKSTAPGNLSMSKIVSASTLRRMLSAEEEDLPTPSSTPPRLSAAPPKTVQVSPQPQQISSAPGKPIGTVKPPSVTPGSGLVSLVQSPNSAMKPVSKPSSSVPAAKPLALTTGPPKATQPGITSGKPPPNVTAPVENKGGAGFSAPPTGIAALPAGSRVKVTQERPSDPAAKVISQNAAAASFPSQNIAKATDPSGSSSFGVGNFGFQAPTTTASATSTAPTSFGFAKPSSTAGAAFSFNSNTATTPKPTPSFSFGGAMSTPVATSSPMAGAAIANQASLAKPANMAAAAAAVAVTKPATSSVPTVSKASEDVTEGFDDTYEFSTETEEWEIVSTVSVMVKDKPAAFDEVTPPSTPATDGEAKPKATEPKPQPSSGTAEGNKPSVFSFAKSSNESAGTLAGLLSGNSTAGVAKKPDDSSGALGTALSSGQSSLGGAGFTFGAAAGSSATTAAGGAQKKDGNDTPTTTVTSSSGSSFSFAGTTGGAGFSFGAASSAGGNQSGSFTFGGGGAGTTTTTASSIFGGAASTGKPLFGGATTSGKPLFGGAAASTTPTTAPTFGATVVSGAGSASAAATSVPASSWKPIVSANSSIPGGSLTAGTPVFGSAAASSSTNPSVTTAPNAPSSTAAAADNTTAPTSTSQRADAAAGEPVSEITSSSTTTSTSNDSGKTLFGKPVVSVSSTSAAPAAASPVVKNLFGQPSSTTAAPAFGAAAVGLKVAPSAASTALSADGATDLTIGGSKTTSGAVSSAADSTTSTTSIATTVTTTTTATGGLFGKPAPTGLFGNGASATATTTTTTSTPSIFGGQSTATSAGTGLFGSGGTSIFGNKQPVSTLASTTTTETPLFGGAQTTSSTATTATASPFGNTQPATTSSAPLFGGQPPAAAASSLSALLGNTQTTPVSTSASAFGQSSGSIFGGTPATGTTTPAFGSQTSAASTGFTFGQSTGSGFGSTAFGQKATPGFGGQPAQPLFGGQSSTTTTSTSGFGQQTTQSPGTGAFSGGGGGAGAGAGGGGGFFSGLGGKPSAENANKNVFGSTTFGTPSSGAGTGMRSGLFGSTTTSTPSSGFGGGAFSQGTSQGASVASTGFGGFSGQQQAASPHGGFGASPAFGGAPAFGSPPAFGGSPGFGSGATFGNPLAAQSPAAGSSSSSFTGFAGSSAPTFGGLAQQSAPSFGDMAQAAGGPSFGSPAGGFGSPASGGVFGGGAGGAAPAFGGSSSFGASPGFGGGAGPSSPSFTSYRS